MAGSQKKIDRAWMTANFPQFQESATGACCGYDSDGILKFAQWVVEKDGKRTFESPRLEIGRNEAEFFATVGFQSRRPGENYDFKLGGIEEFRGHPDSPTIVFFPMAFEDWVRSCLEEIVLTSQKSADSTELPAASLRAKKAKKTR